MNVPGVVFYRAEQLAPRDPRDADRIAGWVMYPPLRVVAPVFAGAVCELPRRTASVGETT